VKLVPADPYLTCSTTMSSEEERADLFPEVTPLGPAGVLHGESNPNSESSPTSESRRSLQSQRARPVPCSYLVPIRWADGTGREEMTAYLAKLASAVTETIVVDGSPPDVFAANRAAWGPHVTAHLPPDPARACLNGKVAGVLTAADLATTEALVIADDDVRYEPAQLVRIVELLASTELVRPQNYFDPLPWHARWDTARMLLNRSLGRDFPGTLAVRRSSLLDHGGYDGDVLFENLELMRTLEARGGKIASPLDLYVRRLPPTFARFRAQRVRQAYDDFALPARMTLWLAIPPLVVADATRRSGKLTLVLALGSVALAERGRRRAGGTSVFPPSASLMAPLWILERGACSWLAVDQRIRRGGIAYAGSRISRAGTSKRTLRIAAALRLPKRIPGDER
jgi:Glycosyltransferase like family 2